MRSRVLRIDLNRRAEMQHSLVVLPLPGVETLQSQMSFLHIGLEFQRFQEITFGLRGLVPREENVAGFIQRLRMCWVGRQLFPQLWKRLVQLVPMPIKISNQEMNVRKRGIDFRSFTIFEHRVCIVIYIFVVLSLEQVGTV